MAAEFGWYSYDLDAGVVAEADGQIEAVGSWHPGDDVSFVAGWTHYVSRSFSQTRDFLPRPRPYVKTADVRSLAYGNVFDTESPSSVGQGAFPVVNFQAQGGGLSVGTAVNLAAPGAPGWGYDTGGSPVITDAGSGTAFVGIAQSPKMPGVFTVRLTEVFTFGPFLSALDMALHYVEITRVYYQGGIAFSGGIPTYHSPVWIVGWDWEAKVSRTNRCRFGVRVKPATGLAAGPASGGEWGSDFSDLFAQFSSGYAFEYKDALNPLAGWADVWGGPAPTFVDTDDGPGAGFTRSTYNPLDSSTETPPDISLALDAADLVDSGSANAQVAPGTDYAEGSPTEDGTPFAPGTYLVRPKLTTAWGANFFYWGRSMPQTVVITGPCGTTTPPPPPVPGPPPTLLSRTYTVLMPALDFDTTSGRVSCVLGGATYEAVWEQRLRDDGTASLTLARYHKHRPLPVLLSVSAAGNKKCPFTIGRDAGVTVPDSPPDPMGETAFLMVVPDSLVCVPGEGLVRVGVRTYDPMQPDYLHSLPAWRYSWDQGRKWHDAETVYDADTDVAAPAVNRLFPTGSRRGLRPLALTEAQERTAGREAQGGASGWGFSQGLTLAQLRLPVWVSRAAPGVFARSSPYGVSNPGNVSVIPLVSSDSGHTVAPAPAAPTLGGVDETLTTVPGYPFAGDWAGVKADSQPVFGFPGDNPGAFATMAGGGAAPFGPLGGLCWAKGATAGRLTLFAPAILRMPIPRDSYTPSAKNELEEGFKQYTDPATATTGLDWGHHTCLVFASTTDAGKSYGDLGVVKVGGTPLLVHTETVRIAAAVSGDDALWLLVCADGRAVLYRSYDAGETWVMAGLTWDGGATWADPTDADIARRF